MYNDDESRGHIVISVYKTYYTEESIDAGESDRAEDIYVNEPFEFEDLVRYIQDNGFHHASDSHGVPRWIMTETEIEDYGTGDRAELSLHPADDEQSQALWEDVLIEAGFPLHHHTRSRGMTP